MKNSKTKDALICLAAGESQVPIIMATKKIKLYCCGYRF